MPDLHKNNIFINIKNKIKKYFGLEDQSVEQIKNFDLVPKEYQSIEPINEQSKEEILIILKSESAVESNC